MAIKYAENTSYNSGSISLSSPNLRAQLKKMAADRLAQAKTAQSKPLQVADVSPMANLSPEEQAAAKTARSGYINSGVPVGESQVGMTLKQYEATAGKPYSNIADPNYYPYAKTAGYLDPAQVTKDAKFAGLTRGGEYLIQPNQPGKGILSERADLNWKENELIRQGLDPLLYQIDHATPLWAGGADTLANKEILDNIEHARKTKIQAVPYTLMANGLITQREALGMATEWKTKADSWDLNYPEPDPSNGMIDINQAKKIAERWAKTPAVTWKSFLKEIPTAGKQLYKIGSDAMDAIAPKSSTPGSAAVREFTKGFVASIPGYDLAMPQLDVYADYGDKASNTTGAVSHVLGSIVGNVITFGAAYKIALRGLSKVGVSWATKELGKEVVEKGAKVALTEAAATGAKDIVGETINPANVGILSKGLGVLSKIGSKLTAENLQRAATLGGVSIAMGQARPLPEDQTRLERAAYDFAYAAFSPVGKAAYNLKGYTNVAMPAFIISTIEGLPPTNAYTNALALSAMANGLISAGTMVGMHGMGQIGGAVAVAKGKINPSLSEVGAGSLVPLVNPKGGVKTQVKPPLKTIWGYGPNNEAVPVTIAPKLSKGASAAAKATQEAEIVQASQIHSAAYRETLYTQMEADLKAGTIKPEDFGLGLTSAESIRYRFTRKENEIQRQNDLLDKYLQLKQKTGNGWSNETLWRERAKVLLAGREIFKGGMGKVARSKADIQDWLSMSERMKKPDPDRPLTPDSISYYAKNIPESERMKAPDSESLIIDPESLLFNAVVPVTGSALDVNIGKIKRIAEQIKSGDIPSEPVDSGAKSLIQGYASSFQDWKGEPWVRIFVLNKNGVFEDVGSIPQKDRIDGRAGSFNENAKKRANVDPETPTTPYLIKQLGLFDPENNNVRVFNEMKKNDTNFVKVGLIFDPEVKSVAAKGKSVSFFKAYFNDATWNPETNNNMKSLMVEKLNYTPEQATEVTKNVTTALKNPPKTKGDYMEMDKSEGSYYDTREQPPIIQQTTVKPVMSFKPPVPLAKNPPDFLSTPLPESIKTPEQKLEEFATWLNNGQANKNAAENPIARSIYTVLSPDKPLAPVISKELPPTLGTKFEENNPVVKTAADLNKPKTSTEVVANAANAANDNLPTALADNVETRTNVQISDTIGESSYGKWNNSDKKNTGPIQYLTGHLKTLDPASPEAAQTLENMKFFDKDVFNTKAKELFINSNLDEQAAKAKFKAEYAKKFTDLGLKNPLDSKEIDSRVTYLFRNAVHSTPKNVLTFVKGDLVKGVRSPDKWVIEPRTPQKSSFATNMIDKWNASNNDNINIIHYEIPKGKLKNNIDQEKIAKEMEVKGYVSLGAADNDISTIYGVKKSPQLGTDNNTFINNFFTKVLGFTEDTTATSINKRSKIFNKYDLPNPIVGETYTHHVINLEKKSLRALGITEKDFPADSDQTALKAMLDKDIYDGKIYITKGMMDRILKEGGYVGTRTRLKPSMVGPNPNGLILEKGDMSIMSKMDKDLFEAVIRKQTGNEKFTISDNDVITFPENIKVGLQDKVAQYSTFDVPSESYRFQYTDKPDITGESTWALSSWARFGKNDGLNESVKALYEPVITKYKDFIRELNNSIGSKEGLDVMKKYSDFGKENFGEDLYDKIKVMVANGAWNRGAGDSISKMTNKILQTKILSGSFIKGAHLTLTPDLGAKRLKTPNDPFLKKDEIMMSQKAWDAIGNPEFVITKRYPLTRTTALSKAKVLVAEDYGIDNLGLEQMIPSHYDAFIRKEGDYDADAYFVFAIDGKNGIPMKVADRIEQIRSQEGDTVIGQAIPYGKDAFSALNYDNLQALSAASIKGGDSIGQIATQIRVLNYLVDSGFSVGEMKPISNKETNRYLSQLQQYALDSIKSPSLSNELKAQNVNEATDLVIKKVFTNVKTSKDVKKIKEAIKAGGYQIPFEIANKKITLKDSPDTFKKIREYNKMTSATDSDGPVQLIMRMLDDAEPYRYEFGRDLSKPIRAAEDAVRVKFNDSNVSSKNTREFIDYFNGKVDDFSKQTTEYKNENLKDFKQSLVDYYRENEGKYNPEEKKAIAVWLAASPKANLANTGRNAEGLPYKNTKWENKLTEIFNETPEVAQTYYSSLESHGRIIKEKLTDASNIINGTSILDKLPVKPKKDGKGGGGEDGQGGMFTGLFDFFKKKKAEIPNKIPGDYIAPVPVDPYSDPSFQKGIVTAESSNMDEPAFAKYLSLSNPGRLKSKNSPNKYQNAGQYGWKVGFTEKTYNELLAKAAEEAATEKRGHTAPSRYRNLIKTLDFSTPESAVNSASNYVKFRNTQWDINGKPTGKTNYAPNDYKNLYIQLYNANSGKGKNEAIANWMKSYAQTTL